MYDPNKSVFLSSWHSEWSEDRALPKLFTFIKLETLFVSEIHYLSLFLVKSSNLKNKTILFKVQFELFKTLKGFAFGIYTKPSKHRLTLPIKANLKLGRQSVGVYKNFL